MEKYDTLLSKLRNTQPVLNNPEELTSRILQKIEHIPQKKQLQILPLVTSLAASIILIWMIVEINYQPPTSFQPLNHQTKQSFCSYDFVPSTLQFSTKEKRSLFYSELKKRIHRRQKLEQLTQIMKDYETK